MFQDRNQTTTQSRKALDGADELIACQLGLSCAADLHRLSRVRALRCQPRGFDGGALVRGILDRIEDNWQCQPQPPRAASRENWRWAKQPRISTANTSREKILEKRIACELDNDWVNQVPTLSGVMDSTSERHCNLDLVHRAGEGRYEFIELKIDSDNPVYAAAELVKYALVYVFSRRHAEELGYAAENELLRARAVRLRVLAPAAYYAGFELGWLETALTRAMSEVAGSEAEFDFHFETIDAKAETAEQCVASRRPLCARDSDAAPAILRTATRVDANGRAFAGSQKQIQTWVNERAERLSAAVAEALGLDPNAAATMRWVSPLRSEGYCEYRDKDFLHALGLDALMPKLAAFWPAGGPVWDALARFDGGCVLVEAKSHVAEIRGGGCKAAGASRARIAAALKCARAAAGANADADWMGPLYQAANRYAHLYFLREIGHVNAYMVNVYFVGDPHPNPLHPTTREDWLAALAVMKAELGLREEPPHSASLLLEI